MSQTASRLPAAEPRLSDWLETAAHDLDTSNERAAEVLSALAADVKRLDVCDLVTTAATSLRLEECPVEYRT